MRVLVACEESQEVCKAFRAKGHEAYSCDVEPCSGGHPEWHIQDDCVSAIISSKWDLIIMHPPCTALAVSGNGTYANSRERISSAVWTSGLFKVALSHSERVAMENPVGVLNSLIKWLPKPYYIQPWQFGHGETKKTGIWSVGLPKLQPTEIVKGREQKVWYMSPGPERGKLRSKTYPGIAKAMADQWG